MANFKPMTQWTTDDEFEYIVPSGKPLTVSWNMYGDEIVLSTIEWDDDTGHRHYTGDELWEMDLDLAEDIMSYIDNEFLESEDFWLTKMGHNF